MKALNALIIVQPKNARRKPYNLTFLTTGKGKKLKNQATGALIILSIIILNKIEPLKLNLIVDGLFILRLIYW